MVSSGCLFVLVVCSAHAHEMAAMLEADMADTAHREGIVLAEFTERGSVSGPLAVSAQARAHTDLILTKAHHMAVCAYFSLT